MIMEQCLVVKLPSSVQNPDLPVFEQSYIEYGYTQLLPQNSYGGILRVSSPIILSVEGSYFTDSAGSANYGTEIEYDGTSNFYIKKPAEGVTAKVKIGNKSAVTQFITIVVETGIGTALILNNESFRWSLDVSILTLGKSYLTQQLDVVYAFGQLINLEEMEFANYGTVVSKWIINNLAEAMIANGRNYATKPTLHLTLNTSGQTKYFDGSIYRAIPSSEIFIIFKSGGYEIRSNSATGTLLYDSLA